MSYDPEENPPDQPPRGGRPNPLGSPRPGGMRTMLVWVLIVATAAIVIQQLMAQPTDKVIETWRELDDWLTRDPQAFKEAYIQDDCVYAELKAKVEANQPEAKPLKFRIRLQGDAMAADYNKQLNERLPSGVYKGILPDSFDWRQFLVTAAFWAALIGVFYFLILRPMRQAGGGGGVLSFGKTRARLVRREQSKITFSDVAGMIEAKEEVVEIIEFLRNPQRFQKIGGRMPRGVMFIGPPGTGKTLLAKAIAGEADVPFFSISGSDFVEMFVGVGASRVRDLFRQAKQSSPCIIFLDEIDAVGRRRGTGFSGAHDEREQTLNAILVEMDGFDTNDQVIVIAATNRVDVLDPALRRPGRFDREVNINLPDINEREAILKVHVRNIRMSPVVDIKVIARGTPGFSGADLAALVNEAALAATMHDKESVDLADMEEARDKVRWGRSRHSRAMDEQEKRTTAIHEAGHALLTVLLEPDAEPLHKVTIIPRGQSMGATMFLPEKDRYLVTRKQCLASIMVSFGGRLAEELTGDDISSGASMDIRMASATARRMVKEWGMSDRLGPLNYTTGNEGEEGGAPDIFTARNYSEDTAHEIDEEVKRISDECYARARQLLSDNRHKLERLAEALLAFEVLDAAEVLRVIEGHGISRPRPNHDAPPADPQAPAVDAKPEAGVKPEPDAKPDGSAP